MSEFSCANTVRSKRAVNANRSTFGITRVKRNAQDAELSHKVRRVDSETTGFALMEHAVGKRFN
jgi:hypothetical protein